jgi:hypothetical protein
MYTGLHKSKKAKVETLAFTTIILLRNFLNPFVETKRQTNLFPKRGTVSFIVRHHL